MRTNHFIAIEGSEEALLRSQEKLRVLVVDDDEAILQIAETALSASGYACVMAQSAEHALMVLKGSDRAFDLLVSDIAMGGMSGIDLMRHAFESAPDMPVVIMSGATELEMPVEAMRAGSSDYLIKPFDIDDLLDCVSRALARRERASRIKRQDTEAAHREAVTLAFNISLDARDKETEGHTERVVEYSKRLGRELGLTEEEMLALELGARLHDIGKIAVPDDVLKKPEPLTNEEWKKMRLHPAKGEQMVRGTKLPEGSALVVGQHHERWDGRGYPAGLAGEAIYIGARVFSVIDTYDAITSDRCYRRGKPYHAALEEILRHTGTQFDPRVVEAFARIPSDEWVEIRSNCPADTFEEGEAIAC